MEKSSLSVLLMVQNQQRKKKTHFAHWKNTLLVRDYWFKVINENYRLIRLKRKSAFFLQVKFDSVTFCLRTCFFIVHILTCTNYEQSGFLL